MVCGAFCGAFLAATPRDFPCSSRSATISAKSSRIIAHTLDKHTAAAAASTQTLQKQLGGVVGISADAGRALSFMNHILNRTGTLANVSLTDAQILLTNLGVLAGSQTEILTARIQELT